MEESGPGQTRSNNSSWASLPLHLMDSILQNLQRDMPSILQIRLVCKAWRTACTSFPGPARITLSRDYDTLGVSNTLPGLQELRLTILATRTYLPALSSLSRLTLLSALYTDSANLPHAGDSLFDLIILPSGLRALELYDCYVDSQSFTHIRCTALTRLEFRWTDNQVWEVEELLQHLPLLKDLVLGRNGWAENDSDSENSDEVYDDFSGFLRCGGLTRLTLEFGELPYSPEVPASAATLQKLRLSCMTVAEPFLHNLPALLPSLTELDITASSSPSWNQLGIHAPSTLRSLNIIESGPRYLGLASPQIESFAYAHVYEEEEEEEMMDCIATLSGLTRLQLSHVEFHRPARMRELRRLHLKELKLGFCSGIATALNHPDAFAVLQKLCIMEDWADVKAFKAAENGGGPTQDLGEVVLMRDNVLKLPSLMELSGLCRIFSPACACQLEAVA